MISPLPGLFDSRLMPANYAEKCICLCRTA
jgi:hypothetical protein